MWSLVCQSRDQAPLQQSQEMRSAPEAFQWQETHETELSQELGIYLCLHEGELVEQACYSRQNHIHNNIICIHPKSREHVTTNPSYIHGHLIGKFHSKGILSTGQAHFDTTMEST